MRSSKTLMTTQHAGTKISFAGFSGVNTITTADHSTTVDSSKPPIHVGGGGGAAAGAYVNDDWGYAGDLEHGRSDSKYIGPLGDMLTDLPGEKMDIKQIVTPGTVV